MHSLQIAAAILADANPPPSYLLVRGAITELDVELALAEHGLDARIVSPTEVHARFPYRSEGWAREERHAFDTGTEREQFEADECATVALLIPGWGVRFESGAFVCLRRGGL
jgi:hypothetical protein